MQEQCSLSGPPDLQATSVTQQQVWRGAGGKGSQCRLVSCSEDEFIISGRSSVLPGCTEEGVLSPDCAALDLRFSPPIISPVARPFEPFPPSPLLVGNNSLEAKKKKEKKKLNCECHTHKNDV